MRPLCFIWLSVHSLYMLQYFAAFILILTKISCSFLLDNFILTNMWDYVRMWRRGSTCVGGRPLRVSIVESALSPQPRTNMVLVLSTLHQLLAQLLALPELHTAILLTPEGQLISVASDISRSKDQARIVAGVSGEVWQETREQGHGMVESEVYSRKFRDQQTSNSCWPG